MCLDVHHHEMVYVVLSDPHGRRIDTLMNLFRVHTNYWTVGNIQKNGVKGFWQRMIKSLQWSAFFSISHLKHMLWTLKSTISSDGSLEYPKQFIKLKQQNNISTILHLTVLPIAGGGGSLTD